MGPGRILQLHATRHCNLRCAHCYSSSGPRLKARLGLPAIRRLLAEAADEGYDVLSLSGGEPLMDPDLFQQLAAARSRGLVANLVTNGTLVDAATADRLAGQVGVVAVSIDGPPPIHDALRRAPGAFVRAIRGLRALNAAGIPVAVIHTARAETLAHLRWLAGLARTEGARALQLHPIEPEGRAAALPDAEFRTDLPSRLALMAAVLAPDFPELRIHVDALPVDALPELATPVDGLLAAQIDPLVVDPDGTLLPWTYGVSPGLRLGTLSEGGLAAAAARFRNGGHAALHAHFHAVRQRTALESRWPFVNWHHELAARPAPRGSRAA